MVTGVAGGEGGKVQAVGPVYGWPLHQGSILLPAGSTGMRHSGDGTCGHATDTDTALPGGGDAAEPTWDVEMLGRLV